MSLRVGIDIGSTTVKVVVLDEHNKLLFRSYERHYSKTRERACQTLRSISEMLAGQQIRVTITGSAGLGVANAAGIDFVQEVYATAAARAPSEMVRWWWLSYRLRRPRKMARAPSRSGSATVTG